MSSQIFSFGGAALILPYSEGAMLKLDKTKTGVYEVRQLNQEADFLNVGASAESNLADFDGTIGPLRVWTFSQHF